MRMRVGMGVEIYVRMRREIRLRKGFFHHSR